MLRRMSEIKGLTIAAVDGDIGTLHDLYLEDETWTVRYLVADTGLWLGRLVAISPISIDRADWQGKRLPIHVTRSEAERAPDLLGRPVTRDSEAEFATYYGYPFYWGDIDLWGWAGAPGALRDVPPAGHVPPSALAPQSVDGAAIDPALNPMLNPTLALGGEPSPIYSMQEITGYHLHATNGEIGHVDDFMLDDESWSIRYLQIDTSNWIGGKTVLLASRWVKYVDSAEGTLQVELTREAIENSPEYDPSQPIDRTFEERLHQHYGRQPYWDTAARARTAGR